MRPAPPPPGPGRDRIIGVPLSRAGPRPGETAGPPRPRGTVRSEVSAGRQDGTGPGCRAAG
eukprot:66841-Hanusia_phi.AAC.1